jgi:hypothetical protein
MAKKSLGSVAVTMFVGLATAASALATGCGDSGNGLAQFVGTWEYTGSIGTFACPGAPTSAASFGGKKMWGQGISSDLVDLTFTCDYRFDTADKIATIQPNQTCLLTDPSTGTTSTDMPSAWTFTLTGPSTAEEKATTMDDLGCTLDVQAQLKKVSKD